MFVITHYPFSRDSLFLSQGPYARKISATCNAYSTDGLSPITTSLQLAKARMAGKSANQSKSAFQPQSVA